MGRGTAHRQRVRAPDGRTDGRTDGRLVLDSTRLLEVTVRQTLQNLELHARQKIPNRKLASPAFACVSQSLPPTGPNADDVSYVTLALRVPCLLPGPTQRWRAVLALVIPSRRRCLLERIFTQCVRQRTGTFQNLHRHRAVRRTPVLAPGAIQHFVREWGHRKRIAH